MSNVAWRYPEATERDVSRALQALVRDLVVRMRDNTSKLKFDDQVEEAQEDNESYAEELIASFLAILPAMAFTIYKFNSKEFVKVAKKTGGAKNPITMLLIGYGANGMESWYQGKSSSWVNGTRDSVRKLIDNILNDWNVNIRNAELKGSSKKEVNEVIEHRFGVYKSWSKNRASGIVGSWNSVLMRQRCIDAGVSNYIWRGQLDERERLSHVKLEGVSISLIASHIFPGEEFGCRCFAQPDWES